MGNTLDVVLEMNGGATIEQPLVNLSKEDQQYVRQAYVHNFEARTKGRSGTTAGDSTWTYTTDSGTAGFNWTEYCANNHSSATSGATSSTSSSSGHPGSRRTPVFFAYQALGLEDGCPLEQARDRYRQLCLANHPDKNPDDPECARKQKHFNAAFEQIKDYWHGRA